MNPTQYPTFQKYNCSTPLTNSSENGESTASERTQLINDFTNQIQIYQNIMLDKLGQNKDKQRTIDLNQLNNQNGISRTSRSISSNHSTRESDPNKFTSNKKIQNFSKQNKQRNSVSRKGERSQEKNKLSKSYINLSSPTQLTPIKKQSLLLAQQSIINKSPNVKTIKLQLEKEKKLRENIFTKCLSQKSKNQSYNEQLQSTQKVEQQKIQDRFDLTPKKQCQGQKDQLYRLNSNDKQKVLQTIPSPKINSMFPNSFQGNKQEVITYGQQFNQVQTKIDFSRQDQKLDTSQEIKVKSNRDITQVYLNTDEYSKNRISKFEQTNTSIYFNQPEIGIFKQQNEQKSQFSEFELLEQNIFRQEQENKEKILLSKNLKLKNYIDISSNIINNQYFNSTPITISQKLCDNDFGGFDDRSSPFGTNTENSLSSSIKPKQQRISNPNLELSTKQSSLKSTNYQDTEYPSIIDSQQISSEIDNKISNYINIMYRNRSTKENNIDQLKSQKILNDTLLNNNDKNIKYKVGEEDQIKGIYLVNKDIKYSYSHVFNRNTSPKHIEQKNEQQFKQITQFSKNLLNQSQEIQVYQNQNVTQYQSDLSSKNQNIPSLIPLSKQLSPSKVSLSKLPIPSQIQIPSKLGSLTQRQQEKQNVNTINISLVSTNNTGSLSLRTQKNQTIAEISIAEKQSNKQIPLQIENNRNQAFQKNQYDQQQNLNSSSIVDNRSQGNPLNTINSISQKAQMEEQNIQQLKSRNINRSKTPEQQQQKYIIDKNKLSESQNLTNEQKNRSQQNMDLVNRKQLLNSQNSDSYSNYNFIKEKSNILNKLTGSYKYIEKSRKYQNESTQPSQLNSQYSLINSQIIKKIGDISPNEYSCISTHQNSNTLFKDTLNTLSKCDIKESINISKVSTIQTNITNDKIEKQRNYQSNASNISLTLKSKNSNDKDISIIPRESSPFNFKPLFFTPLSSQDISDYIEINKRNCSPYQKVK